jgi:hypothetical protein
LSFPLPIKFGDRNHWRLSDLIRYENELAGLPPPEPIDPRDEVFLTTAQVRKRYGSVSPMWVHRRVAAAKAALVKQSVAQPEPIVTTTTVDPGFAINDYKKPSG